VQRKFNLGKESFVEMAKKIGAINDCHFSLFLESINKLLIDEIMFFLIATI
jgi:hypothetical protein